MELKIIIEFVNKYKSIILLIVGFLIGSLLTCNRDKPTTTTTIETKYVVKNHTDTIRTTPKVVYKYVNKVIPIKQIDTVIKNFNPKDYQWVYEKTDTTKNKKTTIKINAAGWGNMSKLDYVINTKDSLVYITKRTETTIIKNTNNLYLSGGYNTNKNISVGVDWTIKNKVIIGGVVEYDRLTNKPIAGVKLGIKL